MDYKKLSEVYEQLESTPKRLEKTFIISQFLKTVLESDLSAITLLLQGRVFPQYTEQKMGMAAKLVAKTIASAAGLSLADVEKE